MKASSQVAIIIEAVAHLFDVFTLRSQILSLRSQLTEDSFAIDADVLVSQMVIDLLKIFFSLPELLINSMSSVIVSFNLIFTHQVISVLMRHYVRIKQSVC
jgi:hypothetical protein